MAKLTAQKVDLDGLSPAFSAADATGDTFANSGYAYLYVKNGDTADHTVTISAQSQCSHGFTHDVDVIVPASGEKQIGTFDTKRFNDDKRQVNVSYDAVTSVTVAVIEQ